MIQRLLQQWFMDAYRHRNVMVVLRPQQMGKKKIFVFFLIAFLSLITHAKTESFRDFEYNGIYYRNIKDKEVRVRPKPVGKYAGNIKIPATVTYNGVSYVVTGIYANAFADCPELSSVFIPYTVTDISKFPGCSNLTSIIVEEGNPKYDSRDNCNAVVESKSNCLISGCRNTVIPRSVTSIGDGAFASSDITSVKIHKNITFIDAKAFHNCSNLTSIVVEEGNPNYDSRNNCNAIIRTSNNELVLGCRNTIIPNTVTDIGREAFYRCESLTSVIIPSSVKWISTSAFQGCRGLTTVIIYDGVEHVFRWAFSKCDNLKHLIFDATNPPVLDIDVIEYNPCTIIYVPDESLNIYRVTWSKYQSRIQGKSQLNGLTEIGHTVMPNSDEVLNNAEEMPVFPGGSLDMLQYLSKNMKYPMEAMANDIQGRVVCSFIVEVDGSLSDINVEKGVDISLDNEAIRLIKNMPKWTPGRSKGKLVRVRYSIPITFRL